MNMQNMTEERLTITERSRKNEERGTSTDCIQHRENLSRRLCGSVMNDRNRVDTSCLGGLSASNQCLIIDFIDANLGEGIRVADLAEKVGLSTAHFARSFTTSFGHTPHRYISRRRIEEAGRLLLSSSQPITEIAMQMGFYSHAHFSQVFREYTGMTPTEARGQLSCHVLSR